MRKQTGFKGAAFSVLVMAGVGSLVTVWTDPAPDSNVATAPKEIDEDLKTEPRRPSAGQTKETSAKQAQEQPNQPPQVSRSRPEPEAAKPEESDPVSGRSFDRAMERYEEKRQNAFFDKEGFVERALAENTVTPRKLADVLKTDRLPASSLIGEHLMEDPGPKIAQRMNALDLLEEIGRRTVQNPQAAEEAAAFLERFVTRRLPDGISEKQLRLLVAEKDDALTKLARLNPGRAVARWKSLQNGKLRQILRGGVLRGLVDSGVALEKAEEKLALR